jgi:class 3 adenylate cyclase
VSPRESPLQGIKPERPSGTVTFLFTDIEGSTDRWERNPAGMRVAVARHDALLVSAIEVHCFADRIAPRSNYEGCQV